MNYFLVILLWFPITAFHSDTNTAGKNRDGFAIFESYNQIHVLLDDKHLASYVYDSTLLKPVLYPIHALSGIRMQREYPLRIIPGESHDHPHHAGLFFTYGTEGEVNGYNFWAGQQGLSKIRHTGINRMETKENTAVMETEAEWIGNRGEVVLKEDRVMIFRRGDGFYSIDFTFRLTSVGGDVIFKDTKEGMFGIRVADWLSEQNGNGEYLNADGFKGEEQIWGKRARWVRLEGEKAGNQAGIIIMNHPESVNYPTFWHARSYGLFAANPLGQSIFEKGRGKDNVTPLNYRIKGGESAVFKFRFIVYDGSLQVEKIEDIFEEYTDSNSK